MLDFPLAFGPKIATLRRFFPEANSRVWDCRYARNPCSSSLLIVRGGLVNFFPSLGCKGLNISRGCVNCLC